LEAKRSLARAIFQRGNPPGNPVSPPKVDAPSNDDLAEREIHPRRGRERNLLVLSRSRENIKEHAARASRGLKRKKTKRGGSRRCREQQAAVINLYYGNRTPSVTSQLRSARLLAARAAERARVPALVHHPARRSGFTGGKTARKRRETKSKVQMAAFGADKAETESANALPRRDTIPRRGMTSLADKCVT